MKLPFGRVRCAIPFVAVVLATCSSPETPEAACTNIPLQVTVTAVGVTPTFSWEPRCGVAKVFVQEYGTDATMWIVTSQTSQISTGITYGQVPINATQTAAPGALHGNFDYFVYLYNSAGLALAKQQFTL